MLGYTLEVSGTSDPSTSGDAMNNAHAKPKNEFCFKDKCLQVGVWGALVAGFLAISVIVPMLALNI